MEAAYCTCQWGKADGWTKQGEDWVHNVCGRPSKRWVEKFVIPRILTEHAKKNA